MRVKIAILLLGAAAVGTWWSWDKRLRPTPTPGSSQRWIDALIEVRTRLGPSQPGDWLLSHEEPGQSFAEYLSEAPTTPTAARGVLYIVPIGDFTDRQREIVAATGEFMEHYFNLPTKVQKTISLDLIPAHARRVHPSWGTQQVLTSFVLDDLLRKRLPADAAAYLALTASDLWPGRGWNFVFGQASLKNRVGVWSMFRNGDPDESESQFRLCLLRTLKTATHETGHMFSIRHCIAYECNMCGSNNRDESDRRTIALCPECHAKVCWATHADPVARFEKLQRFCREYGLMEEAELYARSIRALDE